MVATTRPDKAVALSDQEPAGILQTTAPANQPSNIGDEYWYFFPEGTEGPMMGRFRRLDPHGKNYYCQWMQDEEANYYIDRHTNTVYINNYRQYRSDLSVWRLPTDSAQSRGFLSKVEGKEEKIESVSYRSDGLVIVVRHNENGDPMWVSHHDNLLDEQYFRYSWPSGTTLVDNRDAMHRRGWTYFRITGQINGEEVTGAGRVPFFYAASKQYKPWLRLQVGKIKIVDHGDFVGFGRPWMGLHTIDTVRRDAAERKIWFEAKLRGGDSAEVKLTSGEKELTYTIDMRRDVVEKMRISTVNRRGAEGEVTFEYLQDVSEGGIEFTNPWTTRVYEKLQQESLGMLRLLRLVEEDLIK
jgi:hypothetical protein